MTIGCVMLDLVSTSLSDIEVEKLQHPLTGGVILFSRNFDNQAQLEELCASIRTSVKKPLLIAVDQEGGRVQRFHEEFTCIPAMGSFKDLDTSNEEIIASLKATGWLMASELISSGIDISFAPVLDLDNSMSKVIGNRGFSDNPQQIIEFASAFIKGMHEAGMNATGKHFPGHGSISADSHFELPVDSRPIQDIKALDLSVFAALIGKGLNAVMPAHVIYSSVDKLPACFSRYWLQDVLRNELKFNGTIFSDDLSMQAAKVMGDIRARASEALAAGCDMVLCCNDESASSELLDKLPQNKDTEKVERLKSMQSRKSEHNFEQLKSMLSWQEAQQKIANIRSLS